MQKWTSLSSGSREDTMDSGESMFATASENGMKKLSCVTELESLPLSLLLLLFFSLRSDIWLLETSLFTVCSSPWYSVW